MMDKYVCFILERIYYALRDLEYIQDSLTILNFIAAAGAKTVTTYY